MDASPDTKLLTVLAARTSAGLELRPDALALLADAGISDPATLAAFGLGAGDETLLDGMTDAQREWMAGAGLMCRGRSPLAGPGFVIPTRDPRDHATVLGFVKVSPGQLKHAHLGRPAGIACPAVITDSRRVIVCDNPLLVLRLHQAGAHDVVLAEEPSVLAPLLDWFNGREVIVAGFKLPGINATRAALGRHSERAVPVLVGTDLARSSAEALAILGIDRAAVRVEEVRPPITALLFRDVHAYAVGRLDHPDARTALEALDVADPELVRAWGLGFLPADFRVALSPEQRRALEGHLHGGAVLVPAFDEAGTVVDLACAQPCAGGHLAASVWDVPRGLVGGAVATAFDRLTITDSLRKAGRWFRSGDRSVLWLRGATDTAANAARLAAAGVRSVVVRCRRDGTAVADALAASGIAVEGSGSALSEEGKDGGALAFPSPLAVGNDEPTSNSEPEPTTASEPPQPAPMAPTMSLVRHDPSREEAVFRAGELTITAQVPWGDESTLRLVLARNDRRCADRIDLGQPAQRRRFAASAALRLDVPPREVEHALSVLMPHLRAVVDAEHAAPVSQVASLMTDAEQAESLADLRVGDVVSRALGWLATIGLPGDDDSRLLLFLAVLSRKSDDPFWLALVTAMPGAAHAIDVIAEATPPEELVSASRLTDNALANLDPGALRHRLLVLDDAERVSPAVGTALRILRRRGALAGTKVERDPLRGEVRTTIVETRGPVAVLTASTGPVDERLRPCLIEVPADESRAQVERLLAAERGRRADPRRHAEARAEALRRLRNLQRLVAPRPVLMPFSDEVAVPAAGPHAQRDQAGLLALVSAHALLHQHQRLSDQGAVVATRADLAVARRLAARWEASTQHGLGPHAARLLAAIRAAGARSVTIDQIEASILPGWSRHALRAGLAELVAVDHLSSPRVGRGHRREYHVVRSAPMRYDDPERKVCGLAEGVIVSRETLNRDRKSG